MEAGCPDGMYRKLGDTYTDNVCTPCDPPCVEGVTFEGTACRYNANRRCINCTQEECPPGMYKTANCSATMQRQCDFCSFGGGCPDGSYMATDCTPNTDRTCKPCTTRCPSGQYMASPCNATRDAVCKPCSTPESLGWCRNLSHEAYMTSCTSVSDSACVR